MLITPIPLFSPSLADLRESGNGSNAVVWSSIQGVLLLSHYFLMTDSLANLELIGIIERVPRSTVLFLDDRFLDSIDIYSSIEYGGCLQFSNIFKN